jgi:hypothetical protein
VNPLVAHRVGALRLGRGWLHPIPPSPGRNRSSGGWQERALRAGELVSGPSTPRRAAADVEETVAGGFHFPSGPAGHRRRALGEPLSALAPTSARGRCVAVA